MTRQERAVFLREQLEQARADALEVSAVFDRAIEAAEATPQELDKAAEAVILAAAEVRLAARALMLNRVRP